jgi:hypothetical protein
MCLLVSDKTTTQAPLHSRFARVGEYPFSNSVLAGLRPNFASQNSTKLNIKRNKLAPFLQAGRT